MITGRAWVFGDNVNTDLMAPARLLKRPVAEFASHCMESLQPNFAAEVKRGDIVVGGINFGCGSSREQAPESLKYLGVAAVVARRFARTFYRNAMNIGLPAIVCSEADAIRMANDTVYGLSGYVQSGDLAHARKVASQLRTGNVHLNGAGADFSAPFGGYKQSGTGREWGEYGFEEFLETKAVLGYEVKAA